MQNPKNKRSKIFLNIALVALLALTTTSASMMMGCGSKSTEVSTTPDSPVTETRVVTETQVVSEVVEVTGDGSDNSNNSSDKNSSSNNSANNNNSSNSNNNSGNNNSNNNADNNSDKNSGNNSNNNSNNNSGNNSSGNNSGNKSGNNSNSNSVNNSNNSGNNSGNNSNNNGGNNSNSNNSSSNSGNNSNSNSGNNSNNNNNSSGVLKIGGKSFNVGDTITCKLSIKTPDLIENFQGQIVYDTKYLECTKAKFVGEARGGSVLNFRTTPGIIKFNGSSGVDGYDFIEGATMMEITYTVKAAGSTTPTDNWEIVRRLTENGTGINYISNNKPSNGMTSSLSYSN